MRTFRADYALGIQSEVDVKPILESEFGPLIKLGQYDPFDFEGAVLIEIKTRTCRSTAYPTTMLPYSKIKCAQSATKPVVFVFVFTDGIYWISYSDRFAGFEVSDFQRAGRSDHTDRLQSYCYVPVADLTPAQGRRPPPPGPPPPQAPDRAAAS